MQSFRRQLLAIGAFVLFVFVAAYLILGTGQPRHSEARSFTPATNTTDAGVPPLDHGSPASGSDPEPSWFSLQNGGVVHWISLILLTAMILIVLRLYSVSGKLRGDVGRLRGRIAQLQHDPPIEVERFRYLEIRECAEELSRVAHWLRREQGRLNEDASRDALTNLPNRRSLMEALSREVKAANSAGWPLSLAMVDLDHFKALNDTYGHQAGDFVLKHTSERIASLLRRSDLIARFGGEEFTIVLPQTGIAQAKRIATEVRDALRCDTILFEKKPIRVSASFGVAEFHACGATDPESLVRLADAALYQAKRNGRDTVVLAPTRRAASEPDVPIAGSPAGQELPQLVAEARGEDLPGGNNTMALMGSIYSIMQVIPDKHRAARDTLQQVTAILGCEQAILFLSDAATGELASEASIGVPSYDVEKCSEVNDELRAWFSTLREQYASASERICKPSVVPLRTGERIARTLRLPLAARGELLGVIQVIDMPTAVEVSDRHRDLLVPVCVIGATALSICDDFQWSVMRWMSLLETLCGVIHGLDSHKGTHAGRVSRLSVEMARALNQADEEELRVLQIAGLVHDIGHAGVPQEIFRKKGRLRSSERRLLQEHCRIGAELLGRVSGMDRLANIVLHHHEHFDGSGYPLGLKAEQIPVESRIIGVADAYVAMTSERPYRQALSQADAVQRIVNGSGSQFDPVVVQAFMQCYQAGRLSEPASEIPPRLTVPSESASDEDMVISSVN